MSSPPASPDAKKQVLPDRNILNTLPPELRNRVYEDALTGNNYHVTCHGGERFEWPHLVTVTDNLYKDPTHGRYATSITTMETAFPNIQDRDISVFSSPSWRYWFSYVACKVATRHPLSHEARTPTVPLRRGTTSRYLLQHSECRGTEDEIQQYSKTSCVPGEEKKDTKHPWILPTALLKTCKQMKDEASSIFYAGNTFMFENPVHLELFVSLVLSRPREQHALRSVRLHCTRVDMGGRPAQALPGLRQNTVNRLTGLKEFTLSLGDFSAPAMHYPPRFLQPGLKIYIDVEYSFADDDRAYFKRNTRVIRHLLTSPRGDVATYKEARRLLSGQSRVRSAEA